MAPVVERITRTIESCIVAECAPRLACLHTNATFDYVRYPLHHGNREPYDLKFVYLESIVLLYEIYLYFISL